MSLSSKLLSSYFWVLIGKWGVRSIGLISTLLLVRILTPEDFGIAAQAMMVLMLFQALSNTGAVQYIIKLEVVNNDQLMSSWTLNVIVRVAFSIVVFVTAPYLASFVGEDRLTEVLKVICLVPLLRCLNSPQLIMFRRELRFKEISTLEIIAKVIGFIITISMAFFIQSYWALIWGNLVSVLTFTLASYIIAPKKPRVCFIHIREQLAFTKGIFLTSILGYLRSKADIFIVSHKFGSASVGIYSVSQEFSQLPLSEVVTPMSQPLYSGLANSIDDSSSLQDKMCKYLSVVFAIVLPAIVGIHFLSEELVQILFGEGWQEVAPILSNLSILMLFFATNAALKHVFILKGKFRGPIILDLLGLAFIFVAVYIDEIKSVELFSLYRVAVGFLIFLSTVFIAKSILKFRVSLFFIALLIPLINSCLLALFLFYWPEIQPSVDSLLIQTFLTIILASLLYLLCFFTSLLCVKSYHPVWKFDLNFITKVLSKLSIRSKC